MIARSVVLVLIALMVLAALVNWGDPEEILIEADTGRQQPTPPDVRLSDSQVEFAPMVAPCTIVPAAPREACRPRGNVDCRVRDPRRMA